LNHIPDISKVQIPDFLVFDDYVYFLTDLSEYTDFSIV